jgi:CheY-like chemotaxis protein
MSIYTLLPRLQQPITALTAVFESPEDEAGASPLCDRERVIVEARRFPARRLLVVDDNQDTAESLALFLRLTGHEVRTATDGLAALEVACEFRPDAVILDIGLPGLDGNEVARRLRREPELKWLVLVALTGYGGDGHRRRCLEAGFDVYLVKPADPFALQQLLAGPNGQ